MNNVNSQDQTRTAIAARPVATLDTRRSAENAGSSRSAEPAAATRESGKTLPTEQVTQAEQRAVASTEQAAQREQRVQNAVSQLNDYVQSLQRDLRFSIDETSGRAVVSVIDRSSDEVIRQIPDETALRLARNLKDLQDIADVASAPTGGAAGASLGLVNTRI